MKKCSLSVITLWTTTPVKWRIFPQNDTNATLKCPSESSLHRPSLFNCKESPTSHIFHKKQKRRQDNSYRQKLCCVTRYRKTFSVHPIKWEKAACTFPRRFVFGSFSVVPPQLCRSDRSGLHDEYPAISIIFSCFGVILTGKWKIFWFLRCHAENVADNIRVLPQKYKIRYGCQNFSLAWKLSGRTAPWKCFCRRFWAYPGSVSLLLRSGISRGDTPAVLLQLHAGSDDAAARKKK